MSLCYYQTEAATRGDNLLMIFVGRPRSALLLHLFRFTFNKAVVSYPIFTLWRTSANSKGSKVSVARKKNP